MTAIVWRNVSFSVPWGVISGKECGPSNGTPLLGLHGLLDNANTFDKLTSFLPKDIHFVAVDFPGHGRSSHKPPGSTYDFLDRVTDVRRVVNQLQWKKFSIIGHSMGGGIAAFYAGTFPTDIRHLVLIEGSGFNIIPERAHPADVLARNITKSTVEKEIKPALYPDIEAIAVKFVSGSFYVLSKDTARILAERGSIPSQDATGFEFSHDKRIKNGYSHYQTLETSAAFLSRITCKVLYVRAQPQVFSDGLEARVQAGLKVIRESAEVFNVKRIPGTHHVHIDSPEMVGREITDFMGCQSSLTSGCISKL